MTLKQLCDRYGYRNVGEAAKALSRTHATLLTWHKDEDQRDNVLIPLLKARSPLTTGKE